MGKRKMPDKGKKTVKSKLKKEKRRKRGIFRTGRKSFLTSQLS